MTSAIALDRYRAGAHFRERWPPEDRSVPLDEKLLEFDAWVLSTHDEQTAWNLLIEEYDLSPYAESGEIQKLLGRMNAIAGTQFDCEAIAQIIEHMDQHVTHTMLLTCAEHMAAEEAAEHELDGIAELFA